jgi:hypothetical protein
VHRPWRRQVSNTRGGETAGSSGEPSARDWAFYGETHSVTTLPLEHCRAKLTIRWRIHRSVHLLLQGINRRPREEAFRLQPFPEYHGING